MRAGLPMMEGEITKESCIYCGQDQSRYCYSAESLYGEVFSICRCLRCDAYFLSPCPDDRQLKRHYDEAYYGSRPNKFSPAVEKVLDFFRQSRARAVSRFVRPPARILDVGCGNGRFLGYLIERGYEGYGVELPGPATQRAGEVPGIHLKIGSLEEGDFPKGFFDAVCLWHVFEHLPQPRKTLQTINSVLKPGGFLFLSMPNIHSWQARLFKGRWLHLDPPRHLVFFSPEGLVRVFSEQGFQLCRKTTFSLEQNVFGIQQSILNCICRKRELLFEFLKGNRSYTAGYPKGLLRLQQIFALLTSPLFVLAAALESLFGVGGTMELVFRKTDRSIVAGDRTADV
ncbi:MAG TPA: class I SAM-dependent methyltransferase [Anaerohalosphaeraceae bacterium]|nr:class I SAM-dependent methyltransferase [Anaerohalosphaeraceae bacterium]